MFAGCQWSVSRRRCFSRLCHSAIFDVLGILLLEPLDLFRLGLPRTFCHGDVWDELS